MLPRGQSGNLQQPDESSERKADDGVYIAVDGDHERRPRPLDCVRTSAPLPLAAIQVPRDVRVGQRTKLDLCCVDDFPLSGPVDQAESSHHSVTLPGEAPKHGLGAGAIVRLAEDAVANDHNGVGAEYRAALGNTDALSNLSGFSASVGRDELIWRNPRKVRFRIRRYHDPVDHPDGVKQRSSLG